MVDERVEIINLPEKTADGSEDSFYFEIQEKVGGAGSSKKIARNTLYAAILAAMPPMEHSSLTDLGADDHPQYHTDERGDARYTPISHIDYDTNPDPHPQYQTGAEVDAQIDAKVIALKAESDPFPQYVDDEDLEQEVAQAVAPIAQQAVAEYIAEEGEPLIEAAVTAQLGPAVDAALAHTIAITILSSVAGAVEIDASLGNYFYLELTENVIISLVNPPAAGYAQTIYVQFKQDAVGGHTVTLPAEFKPNGGSDTEVATEADAYTDLAATTMNSGARWGYSMQEQA